MPWTWNTCYTHYPHATNMKHMLHTCQTHATPMPHKPRTCICTHVHTMYATCHTSEYTRVHTHTHMSHMLIWMWILIWLLWLLFLGMPQPNLLTTNHIHRCTHVQYFIDRLHKFESKYMYHLIFHRTPPPLPSPLILLIWRTFCSSS